MSKKPKRRDWVYCSGYRADGSRCRNRASARRIRRRDSKGHWFCSSHWDKFVPEDDWKVRAYGPDSEFARLKRVLAGVNVECFGCNRLAETIHHASYRPEVLMPSCLICNKIEYTARHNLADRGVRLTARQVTEEMICEKIRREAHRAGESGVGLKRAYATLIWDRYYRTDSPHRGFGELEELPALPLSVAAEWESLEDEEKWAWQVCRGLALGFGALT